MTNTYINSEVDNTSYTLSGGDHIYIDKNGSLVGTTSAASILDNNSAGSPVYADVAGTIFSPGIYAYPIRLTGSEQKFVTIRSTGSLEGLVAALLYGPASVNNAGSIVGDLHGVFFATGNGNLVNSGTITSNGDTSNFQETASAVLIGSGTDASATISNSGSIVGINADGINAAYALGGYPSSGYSDSFSITNSGLIQGGGSTTVTGYDPNTGAPTSTVLTFYAIQGNTLADTVNNTGTIRTITSAGTAISLSGGADTVTNGGTISGDVDLGADNDFFDGRNGITNGTVLGGAGNDKLYGSKTADDVLDGGAGADYLNGGGGEDTASYADASAAVRADLPSQSLNTGDAAGDVYVGIEDLTGSAFADTLLGDNNGNVLDGGAGSDTLYGRGGDDFLYGGQDNDTINAGLGANHIDGGDGNDTLTYSDATAAVTVDLSNTGAQTTGGAGTDTIVNVENLTGSAFNDTLTGDSGANIINGGAGADTMTGGAGGDVYYVDNAGDKVIELNNGGGDTINSSVSYSLTGTYVEKLVLTGTSGLNATGNGQANTLVGNSGANVLDGAGGADTLTGGAGADKFLFDTPLSTSAFATIGDFSVGSDLIELDRTIFNAITANGVLAASAFGTGTSATTADQRILYNSGTGDIYYDNDGSGPNAAIKFAHVAANTAITAASFLAIT